MGEDRTIVNELMTYLMRKNKKWEGRTSKPITGGARTPSGRTVPTVAPWEDGVLLQHTT